MYKENFWWYSAKMINAPTIADALLVRLLCLPEGAGSMVVSVPIEMSDLAAGICDPEVGALGSVRFKVVSRERRKKVLVPVRPELRPFVEDGGLVRLPAAGLRSDAKQVRELLLRVGRDDLGLGARPLDAVEFRWLRENVGAGDWCAVVGVKVPPEEVTWRG